MESDVLMSSCDMLFWDSTSLSIAQNCSNFAMVLAAEGVKPLFNRLSVLIKDTHFFNDSQRMLQPSSPILHPDRSIVVQCCVQPLSVFCNAGNLENSISQSYNSRTRITLL